jgi:hypothetical protein
MSRAVTAASSSACADLNCTILVSVFINILHKCLLLTSSTSSSSSSSSTSSTIHLRNKTGIK